MDKRSFKTVAPRNLLSVGLLIAAVGCGRGVARDRQTETRVAPEVTLATAASRTEPLVLDLDGTLLADEESNLTSVVAGRVTEVLVERGAVVTAGTPLIRLRDVDFRLSAQAATASLVQARARLGLGEGDQLPEPQSLSEVRVALTERDLARSNLTRSEELARQNVLSASQIEEVRARAASAEDRYQASLNGARANLASIRSAETQLSQAQTALRESLIRAPFGGEVAERLVSVGEYVSPQTPILSLVRVDPLRVQFDVPQRFFAQVSEGQAVEIELGGDPPSRFAGTVRYISASVRSDSRALRVEAVIPNAERRLRPGLFVRVRLDTGRTAPAVVVPAASLLVQAGVSRVFVIANGHAVERLVDVRRTLGTDVILESGVAAGERIATSSIDSLADGMAVRVAGQTATPSVERRAAGQ